MILSVRELIRTLKIDVEEYYSAIVSRKSGPAVCISLCVLTILACLLPHL